jgi:hypothetical protein
MASGRAQGRITAGGVIPRPASFSDSEPTPISKWTISPVWNRSLRGYPTIHPASVQGVKSASSLFTLRELTSWFGAESQAVQGTTLFRGLY